MTDEEDVVAPLQAAEAATDDPLALLRHWDESQQRTVLCDPAVEDAVRQAVERYNLGHLFKVQTSDVIPDGSVIVVNGHAIEANMREVLRDGIAPRPASYWRADYRSIVDATWRGEFACPNDPRCEHSKLAHDVEDLDGSRPICCVDGCTCGKQDATAVAPSEASPE